MRYVIILSALTLFGVTAEHFVIGNTAKNVILENTTLVQYNAIPFMKRVKYYFYSSPSNRPIQGIQALDTLYSKSSINITAGGLGYPFVNLRLKSERGVGLAYNIGIYVNQFQF